ncbi:MAG: ATP synthase F1 subunit gamma [Verrucomicrobia bacterium]|nr:ATP synthase F1 subunit gamma [Verrucomicrobiota bacterium]MDA1085872.1 ATP synthase F1 subunit gamma [Verrucomicrobiota bacterium]
MANLKELTDKIASLCNTQKMTRTMKLVAASKMRRATVAQANASEYAKALRQMIANVAATSDVSHPLLEQRDAAGAAQFLMIASDRGLCGGFNNNLFRYAWKWTQNHDPVFREMEFSVCGRRAQLFLRSRVTDVTHYEGATERPTYERAAEIADQLMDAFTSRRVDSVYLVFNRFKSALVQLPTIERLLPIAQAPAHASTSDGDSTADTSTGVGGASLFEPAEAELLDLLLPDAVRFSVFNALVENAAGEHAARMAAMDAATNNASDLIDQCTLQRNRERQAAITKELIEIVTGAESL